MRGFRVVSTRCFGGMAAWLLALVGVFVFGVAGARADSVALGMVACPSASQCTAIGGPASTGATRDLGQEVTFNPTAPGHFTWSTIDGSNFLNGVACPSGSQCTAFDDQGRELTFDPNTPGHPTPVTIDSSGHLLAMACASVSQCTAVDDHGRELTFDPTAPGNPSSATIDSSGRLLAMACPSVSRCTAVDDQAREVTFDPTAPGSPTAVMVDDKPSFCGPHCVEEGHFTGIACPSISQCTAIDDAGREVTFDPTAPNDATPVAVGGGGIPQDPLLQAVACPSVSQCTTLQQLGREVTFDPTDPGSPTPTPVPGGTSESGAWLSFVACPSSAQCTATRGDGPEVTFAPTAPGCATRAVFQSGVQPPTVVACPGSVGVGRVTVRRTRATAPVQCQGYAWALCVLTLRLTAIETIRGGKVISISAGTANTHRVHRKPVVLGTVRAAARAGRSAISISLNANGRRLLTNRHILRVRLTISHSGHVLFSHAVTFTAKHHHEKR